MNEVKPRKPKSNSRESFGLHSTLVTSAGQSSGYVQAALNGSREHPTVPRRPEHLAAEAKAAVEAGAQSVHVHAFDNNGLETLTADACEQALRAIRKACPGTMISLTTSAAIEWDPPRRLATIAAWRELPDLVTANQGEEGIVELCTHLLSRGVQIEAGLMCVEDARMFVASDLSKRCLRVLIEPLDVEADDAVRHAEAMEQILTRAGIALPQIHHGDGVASWAVNRRAALRGHGIRTGLEDTPVLPNGVLASGNRELVEAAMSLLMETEQARLGARCLEASRRGHVCAP